MEGKDWSALCVQEGCESGGHGMSHKFPFIASYLAISPNKSVKIILPIRSLGVWRCSCPSKMSTFLTVILLIGF